MRESWAFCRLRGRPSPASRKACEYQKVFHVAAKTIGPRQGEILDGRHKFDPAVRVKRLERWTAAKIADVNKLCLRSACWLDASPIRLKPALFNLTSGLSESRYTSRKRHMFCTVEPCLLLVISNCSSRIIRSCPVISFLVRQMKGQNTLIISSLFQNATISARLQFLVLALRSSRMLSLGRWRLTRKILGILPLVWSWDYLYRFVLRQCGHDRCMNSTLMLLLLGWKDYPFACWSLEILLCNQDRYVLYQHSQYLLSHLSLTCVKLGRVCGSTWILAKCAVAGWLQDPVWWHLRALWPSCPHSKAAYTNQ